MYQFIRIVFFLFLLLSGAVTYFCYALYVSAGTEACTTSSSVVCNPEEYILPLIFWATMSVVTLVVNFAISPWLWPKIKACLNAMRSK